MLYKEYMDQLKKVATVSKGIRKDALLAVNCNLAKDFTISSKDKEKVFNKIKQMTAEI